LITFAFDQSIGISQQSDFMKYNVDKQDNYCIFKVDEEKLVALNAPRLKTELVFLSQEGVKNLILDISSISFIDSSGLSAILTATRIWKEGSFVLSGPVHPTVLKMFSLSKLDSLLVIIPSRSEAVDYVMMEEVERSLGDDTVV
jgi:anti-sigma B factor antagonist